MRRWAGQARRHTLRLSHHGAHLLSEILVGILLVLALGVGGIAWRLSQGPWELPVLARALERAAAPGLALSIGHAALAWEGFARGGVAPLDIRLADVAVSGPGAPHRLAVPRAQVSLSVAALLTGQVRVRSLTVDAPALTLERDAAGNVRIARVGEAGENTPLGTIFASLAAPPGGNGPLSALRRMRLSDGSITFIDRRLGATWNARHLDLALRRAAGGGATATISGQMVIGSKTAAVQATATIPEGFGQPQAGPIEVTARSGAIVPADLAPLAPGVAHLAGVRVPVSASGALQLDAGLAIAGLDLAIHVGSGTVDVHGLAEPIAGADAHITGSPEHLAIDVQRLQVAPRGAPVTTLSGHAELTRDTGGYALTANARLDRLRFADIAQVWPQGVGGHTTESWLASNITAGEATDGQVALSARVAADFSAMTLETLAGGIVGKDLTVHWLAPIAPVEHVNARLAFETPDALTITATSGHQVGTDLAASQARMVISGLEEHDQFADIKVTLAGPAADVAAILGHPRLNLLARAHLALNDVQGQIAGTLHFPRLPLLAHLQADDVKVEATGTTKGLHLTGLVAGRNLDDGDFSFTVSNDGLTLDGSATIAGIAGQVKAALDFRAGSASQIIQQANVTGSATAAALAAAGIDTFGALKGPVVAQASWQRQRGGAGSLAFSADLAAASLTVPRLDWRKPAGTPATLQGRLLLAGERITALDGLALRGVGIDVAGRLAFAAGQPRQLVLDRLVWEPGTDASLALGFPPAPQGTWTIAVSGKRFDVSALLAPAKGTRGAQPATVRQPMARGPAWNATVDLQRLVTGAGLGLDNFTVRATSDGLRLIALDAGGMTGKAAFSASIARTAAGYAMHVSAGDAGALLAATRTTDSVLGGRLEVTAADPATSPLSDWSGTLTMHAFSVRNQPVLGKLLQAMTLYGVLDALRSKGVAFDTLIAPFHDRDETITLANARAFSASLGMTAKGTIDLGTNRCDVQGTLVPAYFFNTLLGRMPFIGPLFSPEKGGGLFAATYGVSGDCDDPSVGVNPLAALTPGFLRGVFGIFDEPATPATPATPGAPAAPAGKPPAAPNGNR